MEESNSATGRVPPPQSSGDRPVADDPVITIKVYHDTYQHEIIVPAQSTFGDLKKALVQVTGLEPHEQRLLFRGMKRNDGDCIKSVGVKHMSKVVLLEDLSSRERKAEEFKRNECIATACEVVSLIRSEVDMLEEKVSACQSDVVSGIKVADKEFVVLSELLMVQLLKLDGIDAEGEAKVQRKLEVNRIQNLVEAVDVLKVSNSEPSSNNGGGSSSNALNTTTK